MHARLHRLINMDSKAIAASLDWLEAEGFARVLSAPGFVSLFFGVNLADGTGAGITFWDSEAAMRHGEVVEAPVRDEALRLARADPTKAISGTYSVSYVDRRPASPGPLVARLSRWEGLRPAPMREALDLFVERELQAFQELPGYRGVILGANTHLGNAVGVTVWQDQDLKELAAVERGMTARFEAAMGGPLRPIIRDSYEVAALPELPQLQPQL
jgi:hypothetical protein